MSQKGQSDILDGIGRDGDLEENVVLLKRWAHAPTSVVKTCCWSGRSGAVVQVRAEVR